MASVDRIRVGVQASPTIHRIVHRLIAILMMLWLPLQVVAGIGAPVCVSPMLATSAMAAKMSQSPKGSADEHHAQADMAATASHQAANDGTGLLHADSTDPQCGDCSVACAAFAVHQVASGLQPVLGEGPAVHGEAGFASVAANQAFEPPIVAA